jgi:hypothetical protein
MFKYPFPGYGLSTVDFSWTGPQLSNIDNTFNILDSDNQKTIKNDTNTTTRKYHA